MSVAWQYTIVAIILAAIVIGMLLSLRHRWRRLREKRKNPGCDSEPIRCAGCAIARVCRKPVDKK